MIENYLQVLEQSLYKKIDILSRIQDVSIKQEYLLKKEEVSAEAFDASIDEKQLLIEELERLDEGFEALYNHVKEQLSVGKEKYSNQISRLQGLITKVTEKSVAIQTQETRNNKLAKSYFTIERKNIQKNRTSSKAALNYYKSMNNSQSISPQFMDKKK
ncbi:flagellar protein FliT [Kineothrix sp. MB12-C1]|uniref:flagellar protein FliT n=1 Tax=Kineothrix sp. MB12-C1 TaxID=3070215 RepID=UPI0027D3475D|nr:flagellar protein FliT [Kineothrix sp. MB12-C1]WMC93886.1 flagellar protein FliT [Kineothrix sp. MB12-C1]